MRPARRHNAFLDEVWSALSETLEMVAQDVEPGQGETLDHLRARFGRVVEELKLPESREA